MLELLMIGLLISIFVMPFIAIGAIIALIVMAIMKKGLKIPSIVLGSSIVLFVVLLLSVNALDGQLSNQTASNEPSTTDTSYETEEEVIEAEEPEIDDEIETDLATEEIEEESDDSHLTKDGRDPTDFSEYNADIDMKDIERNPEEYQDEWIAFEGRIIQVMEDDVTTAYRIAVNDDIDRVVYVETLAESLEERLLEDDHVEVYGSFYDLVTYETVMGANQTIPAFNAYGERIVLQETAE